VLEPSACCGFYAVEARARRRVDNLPRHANMTSEEKVDARVQAKLNMYDYATFVETDPWCELVHSEPPFFDSSFVQPGRANGPY